MVSYVDSHYFPGESIFMSARFCLYVLHQCAYQRAQSVFQIAPSMPSIADPDLTQPSQTKFLPLRNLTSPGRLLTMSPIRPPVIQGPTPAACALAARPW
jgi:hypothetical protein